MCLSLATPWTVTCQAPLSMGFSRQEYWSGLPRPAPGDLPDPGMEPGSPALPGGFFYQLWYQGLLLVPSGCYNRILQSEWLINHRQLFLSHSCGSSKFQIEVTVDSVSGESPPPSWFIDGPLPSWFTKGFKSMWLIIWENVT